MKRKDFVLSVASLVVILAGLAWIGWRIARGGGSVENVSVFPGEAVKEEGGHRIPITVRNDSDRIVSDVTIAVVLWRGDEEVERAETEIGSIAPFREEKGSVTLKNDPKCCAVVAQAE